MEHVDDLTRQKIREWQLRRLEIKDQMAASPERVLELSQVLDQMEEEHERILEEAAAPVAVKADAVALELQVSARSVRDLRKLLELALHELDGVLDAPQAGVSHPGDMSGSLGAYRFDLVVGQAAESDKP
ncbi:MULTISPECIES: hypothetical protein [unclassified Pseudomonas]|uniref:hypothetical protein n=1 Tax=unclassified Pseudomonas TaxID=196821 RepID=UPI000C88AA5D|nr:MULTISPECIES: hypothetical protein [unclassified Pseudomonas]PMZ91858.1 hypothetical protein C1X79_20165 [Pseudomonas sp. FW305-42]PNA24468.1 hypothetical protein C1X78_11230 [Pseudomonas sp. MPR-R1B]PNB25175.1 hypothetical protein C1X80_14970 [Pseudomonas sp. DP16D-E2]PNB40654.1 hypothetical protein C1X75_24110 [Pseudomonas sp. FW305-17]PNB57065.1 hypothetical protein C1X77_21865 [Pseudomonas sp. GW531-E2]